MKPYFGEFDFTPPCFKSYLLEIDPEYQEPVEQMLKEAFLKLCFSEKLMLRPFIEVKKLKSLYLASQGKEQEALAKKIKSRLSVINENGDVQVLVKRFNIILLDLHRKKSIKTIAKMGADALLMFIEELKSSGELQH
jgi:hypothetical protein